MIRKEFLGSASDCNINSESLWGLDIHTSTIEPVVLQQLRQKGTTSMKALLFTILLCIGACLGASESELIPMASVLMNSTVLHKCNAFFIERNILLTTASCVSCRECHYQITLESEFLIGDSGVYDVVEVKIHQNYTQNPDKYNAAKLYLRGDVKNAVVYKPATSTELSSANGTFVTWRFDDNMIFSMAEHTGIHVSREIYHRATDLYIQDYQIAMMSLSPVSTGPYDEGSPFFVKVGNVPVVFGYLAKPKIQKPGKFFALMSIPHLFHPSSRLYFHSTE